MADWNAQIIEEFRQNAGGVGGIFTGKPLLLLHHKGAKTGTDRVSPLMYQEVDGGFAVFASKAGADTNPAWMHNLLANPDTVVEVGTERIAVSARLADDGERTAIWERQKSDFPQFAEYEQSTSRQIPVFVLDLR
jgi:deazaflavin-dependent oxidoreductase (nitroreductase family)